MKPDSFTTPVDRNTATRPIATPATRASSPATAPFIAPSSGWLKRLRQHWLPQDGGQELDVRLFGRAVRARLSPKAVQAASQLREPLTVEMELYFSCLVRKAVYFSTEPSCTDLPDAARTTLLPNLQLQFRPVTTAHCQVAEVGDKPPVETMPVVKPQAFVPRWVNIDFHRGHWLGEYGY